MNKILYITHISLLCILHAVCPYSITTHPQKIAIIGTGYVGLVSGACLASMGHTVTCIDTDQEKIESLKLGKVTLYEPNLTDIIAHNVQAQRLSFCSNIQQAMSDAAIIIIAVGTPADYTGDIDLSALQNAVETVAHHLTTYKVICIKSTVPPGTNEAMKLLVTHHCNHSNFDVVSNPEFLREGCAISDFFQKNPIVLGSDSDKALEIMEQVYQPLCKSGRELIKTNFPTAELIKYAWNAFSTIKISYVNELSLLCNKLGADAYKVIFGMSFSDDLLPMRNIQPGPGIGGSCLPKDTRGFASFAEKNDLTLGILEAAIQADYHHKQRMRSEFFNLLDNKIAHKKIALLGLSFKANTDDIRSSPAIMFIENLLAANAHISVYDPKAMNNMQKLFPDITYCSSAYEAVDDADALLLLTDWDEFKALDIKHIANIMKQPIVMDTRNMWSPNLLKDAGFIFKNLGRIQ